MEWVLIALFTSQVILGVVLLTRRLRQRSKTGWSWVQLASGAYLTFFVLNHVYVGVLRGRTCEGVDTGFWFVASTVTTMPAAAFFRPYYVLAVLALFAHVAAALHWRGAGRRFTYPIVGLGLALGSLIVATYSGFFFEIDLPKAYRAYIEGAF